MRVKFFLLKKGVEAYSRTPEGALYSFSWLLNENCEIAGEGEEASLADYAVERRVIPVSPRLFYAYLATVAIARFTVESSAGPHGIPLVLYRPCMIFFT